MSSTALMSAWPRGASTSPRGAIRVTREPCGLLRLRAALRRRHAVDDHAHRLAADVIFEALHAIDHTRHASTSDACPLRGTLLLYGRAGTSGFAPDLGRFQLACRLHIDRQGPGRPGQQEETHHARSIFDTTRHGRRGVLDARASGERRAQSDVIATRRRSRLEQPRRRRGLSTRLPRGRTARRRGRPPQPRVQRAEPSRVSRGRCRLRPQRRLARSLSRRVRRGFTEGYRVGYRDDRWDRSEDATADRWRTGTAPAYAARARRAASATATARAPRIAATTTGSSRTASRKCGRAPRRGTTTTSGRATATRSAIATASARATRTASAAPTRGGTS